MQPLSSTKHSAGLGKGAQEVYPDASYRELQAASV